MSALAYNDVRRLGEAPPQIEVRIGDTVKCVKSGQFTHWRHSARKMGKVGQSYKVLAVSDDFARIQVTQGNWTEMIRFRITARA